MWTANFCYNQYISPQTDDVCFVIRHATHYWQQAERDHSNESSIRRVRCGMSLIQKMSMLSTITMSKRRAVNE